jgi:hypothetical protein
MKNFKKFTAIILGIIGITTFSSCGKDVTCKCSLEDTAGVDVYIDIQKGKCEDISGKFEYDGYSYDIRDCKED